MIESRALAHEPATEDEPRLRDIFIPGRLAARTEDMPTTTLGRSLPAGVTPLDALFAVGPHRSAFRNARTGAKIGIYVGVPASIWLLWSTWSTSPLFRPADLYMLVLEMLSDLCLALLFWAAQGFLLGLLWRRLPSRRGPAKALALTAVTVAALGVEAGLNTLLGEQVDQLVLLQCALTFVGLSVIAVSMDLATIRQLGPRSARTLLASYRLSNATSQATFALAQLAAVLAIYSFVRNGGDAPPFPGIDPFSIGQRTAP